MREVAGNGGARGRTIDFRVRVPRNQAIDDRNAFHERGDVRHHLEPTRTDVQLQ